MSDALKELIMSATPVVTDINSDPYIYFNWGWDHRGFGQLSVYRDPDTSEIVIANECMSRESVRKILHALADYIADNGKLEDEQFMI